MDKYTKKQATVFAQKSFWTKVWNAESSGLIKSNNSSGTDLHLIPFSVWGKILRFPPWKSRAPQAPMAESEIDNQRSSEEDRRTPRLERRSRREHRLGPGMERRGLRDPSHLDLDSRRWSHIAAVHRAASGRRRRRDEPPPRVRLKRCTRSPPGIWKSPWEKPESRFASGNSEQTRRVSPRARRKSASQTENERARVPHARAKTWNSSLFLIFWFLEIPFNFQKFRK